MRALLIFAKGLGLGEAAVLSLLVNVALFAVMLAGGAVMARVWAHRRVALVPPPLTGAEIGVAAITVVLNAGVMLAGWALFLHGILRVDDAPFGLRWLTDAIVLTVVMDLAMYVTHRAAHLPIVFRWIHGMHHRHEQPRPLTLFVLHPVEVVGFGGLWIAVLCTHAFSLGGMLLYLTLNSVFGTFGHIGVEPMPPAFARWAVVGRIGTSTFHTRHHQRPATNFGFYTSFWDRLFGTLDPDYVRDFGQPPLPRSGT